MKRYLSALAVMATLAARVAQVVAEDADRIAIADASADGFTLTATPLGAQARDTICNPMRLQHLHTASVVLSSGADLSTDTGRCWRQ